MSPRMLTFARRAAGTLAAGVLLALSLPTSPASAAPSSGHPQRLTGINSAKCLEIPGWSTANGAAVGQWGCHLGGNQQWYFSDQGATDLVWNANSGKCLEVADWSTANGATVRQWDCHGGANQQWQSIGTTVDGQDVIALRNLHSGKCLEIADWRKDNGAPARQWDCHWGYNQLFYAADVL
ncbi:RICIN domain-containing protein [Streptomyces sp. NPDC053493]|uniref:RICIN domain-containing protein n=1 Tax=Streptomyces sp. NPDC053493 TaxID=3365705 RepID=UPI0037D7137E